MGPAAVSGVLDDDDRRYLRLAVELSRSYHDDQRRWPFGAILVADGTILGQEFNQVVELHDPAAHAEIMALREDASEEDLRQDAITVVREWNQRYLRQPASG
jgi:tRNA(Arg) A34 adenosine deaminase TadA